MTEQTEPVPAAIPGWYRSKGGFTANPEYALRRPVQRPEEEDEER